MLSAIAQLVAITYLPGAVVFRLPLADRARRAALPAEERLFWMVVLSVAVTTTLALVLAAMGVYSLGRLVLCDVALALLLALASVGNLKLGATARPPGWTALLPVALIAIGIGMYFAVPSSEWVLGGRDPGVYMNAGIQIAQRQSLVTTDPVVAAVPPESRDLFFPFSGQPSHYSVRFMGFHLRDPETGAVTGQFPQGYPIWVAIAYGLDGVTGTRRVIAWWAILGVLAVYFAGRRLIGAVPAAAAAGLLAVHVIQTWYARYPNSEMLTQGLVFAALLAHAYAHQDEDRFFGPIAASLLGLGLFTRFPVVIPVSVAVAASLLAPVSGHRARAGFLVTLAVWIVAAGAYYTTQLQPYFARPIDYFNSLGPVYLVPLALAATVVAALLLAIRRPAVAAVVRTWLPLGLVATVVGSGIYALYFREPGGHLAPHDAHAVRVFVYLYFTPIAFGLALIGYALVVWRSFWRAPALILALTVIAGFFLYKMRIWPEHFWLARRFIPAILPGALIFAAGAIFAPMWAGFRVPGPRVLVAALGLVVVFFLGQRYLSASAPIRTHIEYADVIPRIEKLAAAFGDRDLVLVESRAASDLHTLALPLAYIWARNVLVLYSSRPDKTQLADFLTSARTKYDNVYFVGGGGTDLLSPRIQVEAVKSEHFTIPQYELTDYPTYPRRSRTKPFDVSIFRIVDPAQSTRAIQSENGFRVDVGGDDDLHVIRFHGKERWGGTETTFRWTRERSYLSVPSIAPGSRELLVRMSHGGRPPKAPPARATLVLDEREIGTAKPDGEFRDYTFAIPADLAAQLAGREAAAEIRIDSTAWTPREVLGNADERQLGVAIDRVEIH